MLDTVAEVEAEEGISGGWHVFIRISLHCLLKIEECLTTLPKVAKKSEASYIQRMDVGIDINRFVTNVTPYVNHLECESRTVSSHPSRCIGNLCYGPESPR